MGLRDIGATLPPGFRFYPSDEELVCHYLFNKIANDHHQDLKGTLVDVDLHACEPWQLPEVAKLNATEWYFFSFRDRKYATGYRANRATSTGYWKATGKDRMVHDPATRQIIGMRKTLVFYKNRAPNGIKTGWIMHEFRLESPHMPPKEDWVLCRVFHKSKGSEDSNMNNYSPNKMSQEILYHGTNNVPPLVTHDHNINATMPFGYQQNQNSSLLNLLQFSDDQALTDTKPQHDQEDGDDYGFLWDMNLENELSSCGVDSNMGFI